MEYMKLDSFTQAYVETALSDEPLDKNYSVSDIAPDTLAKMVADCAKFQAENETPEYSLDGQLDSELAGHDFWLTRNYHGAGFWDGDLECATGERLTTAAQAFGKFNLYVGDDGQIHGSPL